MTKLKIFKFGSPPKKPRGGFSRNIWAVLLTVLIVFTIASPVMALDPTEDPTNSAFKLIICDGPEGAGHIDAEGRINPKAPLKANYKPCNFRTLLEQAEHLINIMLVLGVMAAIVGFAYAGGLYVTGQEKYISRAHEIFPKVVWGFIIMLTAWFMVFQLLEWLAKPGADALLKM